MLKKFRLAAVGDLHCGENSADAFRYAFEELNQKADILVLCGDLTSRGKMSEIEMVVEELGEVCIPVLAVLGNHDYHEKNHHRFHDFLEDAGILVLDGDTYEMSVDGQKIGFAGTKGFAGGFGLRALPDFGEELWRMLYREINLEAEKIERGLESLNTDIKIAVLHYSPIIDTLTGEDPQVYAFLGSSELATAIDKGGADLVIHGHAHFGQELGRTPGGICVRNVSQILSHKTYTLIELDFPDR